MQRMITNPVNVLFVEAALLPYGSSRSLLSLMTNLDPNKVRPMLACHRENDLLRWAVNEGIEAFPLSLQGLPLKSKPNVGHARYTERNTLQVLSPTLSDYAMFPVRMVRDALEFHTVRSELLKIIAEKHIKILHLNNQAASNRFGYRLGSTTKIVQHVRGAPLARSFHVSKLVRRAERVIAISQYVAADAALAYSRAITDVVANPVDATFTFSVEKRAQWRQAWKIPNDVLLFGQAGRFIDMKGTDTAIEAYTRLCADPEFMRSTRLVLVGSAADQSDNFERCERMAALLPPGQVRIEPFSKDAAGLFSAFDVTLHPIRQPEGFGRVIVESMACRSVPLARDLGAIGELITHGMDGLLFADIEGLYSGMLELYRNRTRLEVLADNGLKTAQLYDPDNIARQVEQIYDEVMAS